MDLTCSTRSCLGLLTLKLLPGVGPKTAASIVKSFEHLGEVLSASTEGQLQHLSGCRLPRSLTDEDWRVAHAGAIEELRRSEELGIRVIGYYDDAYPSHMKRITDPPLVIYIRGQLQPGGRYVACVGTRHPTKFGVVAARKLSSFLAESGWGIVSGLAAGIDTESHEGALEAKGHTVAILANGLDSIYPKQNERLAETIVESGGALISEQPIGAKAFAQNLVNRDRLQSGMSVGTVVMQTDIVGGTMHTVRFTLMQNRLLFCSVPTGQYTSEDKSRGNLALVDKSGVELAPLLAKSSDYASLLRDRFRHKPPAIPIRGREEYRTLLSALENRLSVPELSVPEMNKEPAQGFLFRETS